MWFKKNLLNFTRHPVLHCFILTNFILKHNRWYTYQKSYNNNVNNETRS